LKQLKIGRGGDQLFRLWLEVGIDLTAQGETSYDELKIRPDTLNGTYMTYDISGIKSDICKRHVI